MRMCEEDSIHRILKELENTKRELKSIIEASEFRILNELTTKIKQLEVENACLKKTIENLEIKNRKNNIVLFGFPKDAIKDLPKICQDLSKILKIKLTESDISDVYCLGSKENCPIKLELVTQLKKKQILANTKNLKGTKIFLTQDLTKQQQVELKILKEHLKIVREEEPEKNSYIRGNKLFIDYKGYSCKELEEEANVTKTERRVNSAPPTPSIRKNLEDDVFAPVIATAEVEKTDKITVINTNNTLQTKYKSQIKETEIKQTPKRTPPATAVGETSQVTKPKSLSSPSGNKMTTRQGRKQ